MTDSSSPSFFSEFGLLLCLEELNKEELQRFKFLLKNEAMKSENYTIPWAEVKKAKREDLANLMNMHYPGKQAFDVALKIFDKMNRKDLCDRVKSEVNRTAQTMEPEGTRAGEETEDDQEAGPDLGDGTEYRMQIMGKFCFTLSRKCFLGEHEDFRHEIAMAGRELLEQLFAANVNPGEQPRTVVLHGVAGVGKSTLVRKAIFDWSHGELYQQFAYIFYLSAREINQWRERSFVQIISKDWPSTEGPIERIMSQPNSILFIIDSFDELNFAFEEPEFALCEDWTQVHPVSFLMSSLLRRVMLPESSLLVTTRITAYKKLRSLLKSHHLVELLGLSRYARQEYIYQFFEDTDSASQILTSIKNNDMLFSMCTVPLLCWAICSCLEQQMEKGGEVTLALKTTTALFTCLISDLFSKLEGSCYSLPNQTQLRSLCHLAAKSVCTMTHVLYRENLRKHGLTKSDVTFFLAMNVLQKDTHYENCYEFTHLHIQEFFAAMLYILEDSWESTDKSSESFEDLKMLLRSTSYKDPHLTQMKCFLFGLLNENCVKQLEEAFNCKMSPELKEKILEGMEILGNSDSFPSQLGCLELFYCLYETQDEAFISQAMRYFQKVAINICGKIQLLVSASCLKHCQCLQTIKLRVTEVFETANSSHPAEAWQINAHYYWMDLCSVLHTNEHLRELELGRSSLDGLATKIFFEQLKHPTCKLQKLLLRFFPFPNGCWDIASCLTHNQNLRHLDLKGSDIGDNGAKLVCEALRHPDCKLQSLSLESCDLTTLCCLDISNTLIRSQNLLFLSLSTNNLLDDGVELLCEALRHPKCHLERLSLESCGVTVAGCKDLSVALITNKRLTHLCLADNILGDGGVKFMSHLLKHPQCSLQSLVLRRCHFTSVSSEHLSSSLLSNKSLTHLDLGSNWLQDDGVKLLCNVFRHPGCNLQDLELMGCVLTSACCLDLASAIVNNPNLQSLDLGYNDLQDDGVKILCEALRDPECNIQRLGLEYCGLTSLCCQDLSSTLSTNRRLIKMNLTQNCLGCEGITKLCEVLRSTECKLQVLGLCKEAFDKEAQKLLEAVGVSNPHLVIKHNLNDCNEDGSWWQCF